MKPSIRSNIRPVALVLALAGWAAQAQAQSYFLAGNFEGWCNNCTPMIDNGVVGSNGVAGSHQWEYDITGQTPSTWDANGMKVTDGTWNNTWPGQNMFMYYNSGGNATIYFYPGTFADGWTPAANRIGFADPGLAWEVAGDFTTPNWDTDPNAQLTLVPNSNGIYTNTYIVATAGTHNFKFRTAGTWNNFQIGSDFSSDGNGNGTFTTATPNQAVLFVLDLPNGRWQAGGPPAYADVQFAVDMTLVAQSDTTFNPASVTINGEMNGWGGTACTNDPAAANTNVYYSPYFHLQVGTTLQYQYRYTDGNGTQYDAKGGQSGNNRTITVPNVTSTNLPPVYWNDALPTDLLNVDTTVTFSVNMTNAVGVTNGVPEHTFDPNNDFLFVNGDFSGWLNWDPITLYSAGLQLQNNPAGSGIYTYTTTFPAGHSRILTYKYSINGVDDEAGFAQNHFRYIRSTNGVDNLPLDTFGVQYSEPKVGGLTVGTPAAGVIPINWLSYPNVHLQVSTNLTDWQDVPNSIGSSSASWPMTNGAAFFRLIQPAN